MNLTLFGRPMVADRPHLIVTVLFALALGWIPPLAFVSGWFVASGWSPWWLNLSGVSPVHLGVVSAALVCEFVALLFLVSGVRLCRSGQGERYMRRAMGALLLLGVASVLSAACMVAALN